MTHPDFAGKRLVACRNPELAKLRAHKSQSLLEATTRELAKIQTMMERGKLKGKDKIDVRVTRVVSKELAKHFVLEIRDDDFDFHIDEQKVATEAKLDDETELHSFQTLLRLLSTIVRNVCRVPGAAPDALPFHIVTTPDPKQQRAYDLLETITVSMRVRGTGVMLNGSWSW